jgi:hypothetical protein
MLLLHVLNWVQNRMYGTHQSKSKTEFSADCSMWVDYWWQWLTVSEFQFTLQKETRKFQSVILKTRNIQIQKIWNSNITPICISRDYRTTSLQRNGDLLNRWTTKLTHPTTKFRAYMLAEVCIAYHVVLGIFLCRGQSCHQSRGSLGQLSTQLCTTLYSFKLHNSAPHSSSHAADVSCITGCQPVSKIIM